jgi:hypothetical protein
MYRTNPAAPGLAPCFEGYVEAALFASTDDEGRPLDENFSRSDFSPESLNQMYDDCDKFIEDNQEDISEFMDVTGKSMEDVGHDFFLTRCGHGAGFWDRGAGAVGERLSKAAKDCGHQDVYVGDEGELHVSGGARSNPSSNPRFPAVTKQNLMRYFASSRRSALSEADASRLVKACREATSNAKVDAAMELANRLLGGFGVEAIGGMDVDSYYQNTVALYVNMGDTYDATVLFDTVKRKFYITSVGDFVEAYDRAYEIF